VAYFVECAAWLKQDYEAPQYANEDSDRLFGANLQLHIRPWLVLLQVIFDIQGPGHRLVGH